MYATVESDPYIDLGRHRVDLARLLPVSLEEQSSGEWSTSFQLSGKATGASLNVSFGFSLAVDSSSRRNWKVKSSNQQRSGRCEGPDQLQRSWSCFRGQSIDVSDSLLEYSELKIDSLSSVEVSGELSPELKHCMEEGDELDYVVIDKGIELEDGCMKLDSAIPELETVFSSLSVRHENGSTVMSRSNSLDDLTETVASEFLSMLEAEASSVVGGMEPQYGSNWRELSVVSDHTSNFHNMGMEHSKASQTEALRHDWGLNEEAFGSSPPRRGFGSPIELPFEGEPKTLGEPKVKDLWSQEHLWRL